MILTYVIFAVIVILVLWAIIAFNGLVRSKIAPRNLGQTLMFN